MSPFIAARLAAAKKLKISKDFFFKKNVAQSRPLFYYICSFLIQTSIIQIGKSVDGVLGIQILGLQNGRRRQNHGALF